MPSAGREPSASVELTRLLLRHATALGIDAGLLCRSAGLDASDLERPDARVPAATFGTLWEQLARRSGDHDFGLHFGEAAGGLPSGHLLTAVMLNCPTAGAALERFVRYHGLMADIVQPAIKVRGGRAHLIWQAADGESAAVSRHYSEAILAMFVSVLGHLTEDRVELVRVGFRHPRPGNVAEHERVFRGVPLHFGQGVDELVLPQRFLETPVFLANPALLQSLEQLAQQLLQRLCPPDTTGERVVGLLGRLLPAGSRPSLPDVARELAMSPRSLQKSLQQEGTTYQRLLDQVRHELAVEAIVTPGLGLCDVAFLLGFAEQSAFTHAFKRWTGVTPGEYRQGVQTRR